MHIRFDTRVAFFYTRLRDPDDASCFYLFLCFVSLFTFFLLLGSPLEWKESGTRSHWELVRRSCCIRSYLVKKKRSNPIPFTLTARLGFLRRVRLGINVPLSKIPNTFSELSRPTCFEPTYSGPHSHLHLYLISTFFWQCQCFPSDACLRIKGENSTTVFPGSIKRPDRAFFVA